MKYSSKSSMRSMLTQLPEGCFLDGKFSSLKLRERCVLEVGRWKIFLGGGKLNLGWRETFLEIKFEPCLE